MTDCVILWLRLFSFDADCWSRYKWKSIRLLLSCVCTLLILYRSGRIYTISPGCRGSMAESRPATAARGLPWRAEMQPNCPGYQERLCLSSWNRSLTRTGKARKDRTRRESFLARKTKETFSHVRLQISALRRRFCNLTWLESADSVLAKQVLVQSSRVHVRSQNLATFIRRYDWSVPWLQTCDIW